MKLRDGDRVLVIDRAGQVIRCHARWMSHSGRSRGTWYGAPALSDRTSLPGWSTGPKVVLDAQAEGTTWTRGWAAPDALRAASLLARSGS